MFSTGCPTKKWLYPKNFKKMSLVQGVLKKVKKYLRNFGFLIVRTPSYSNCYMIRPYRRVKSNKKRMFVSGLMIRWSGWHNIMTPINYWPPPPHLPHSEQMDKLKIIEIIISFKLNSVMRVRKTFDKWWNYFTDSFTGMCHETLNWK